VVASQGANALSLSASGRGEVSRVAALAMKRGKRVNFTGYWQRHIANYYGGRYCWAQSR